VVVVVVSVTCLVEARWVLLLSRSSRLVLEDTLLGVVGVAVVASSRLVVVEVEASVLVEVKEATIEATSEDSVKILGVYLAWRWRSLEQAWYTSGSFRDSEHRRRMG
jgi:hypothetical protein